MKPTIPLWLRGVIAALLMSLCVILFIGIVYSQSSPNPETAPAGPLLTPTPSVTPTATATLSPCPATMRTSVAPAAPNCTLVPTATPTRGGQTALVTITLTTPTLQVVQGELLTVTVAIQNQPRDCSYSMYDLTLLQSSDQGQPLFDYATSQRLGPPAPTYATFVLRAIHAGTATLTASLYGEDYCQGAWSWAYRTGSLSGVRVIPNGTPTFTPTPTGALYTIRGHVAEFPPCQGSMHGDTVRLEPLGLTTQTDLLPGGNFSFTNIPNGVYTVRVPGCNPYGCWIDAPVTVNGADAYAGVCMATFTPTPTATPTPTVAPTFEAKVHVTLPKTTIHVGETITALVTIDNRSVGCQYPVYDLTLAQQGSSIFQFNSPTVVGPPVAAQTVFTLTAITPGMTTLHAVAYGERNCDGFWQWTYVEGDSAPLTVTTTQTHIVTTTADSGPGSLRQLIADAAPDDTIRFDKLLSGQTITLSNQLWLTKTLTIDGSTLLQPITLSGNHRVRVLAVDQAADVTLLHLSIANGGVVAPVAPTIVPSVTPSVTLTAVPGPSYNTGTGAGLLNDGRLTLHRVIFTNNHAGYISYTPLTDSVGGQQNSAGQALLSPSFAAPGGSSGAIHNTGVLTITDSTFQRNKATNGNGGAIGNHGEMTVRNSSFVDNYAGRSGGASGGAIYNEGWLTIVNSTLSHNQAEATFASRPDGAAIGTTGSLWLYNSTLYGNDGDSSLSAAGTVHLYNSIIAGSIDSIDCEGTLTTNVNTLIGDGSCGATLTGNPKLGPLTNNGGGIQTHTLLPGSPALDTGDSTTCSSTDQRGLPRPQDGNGDGVAQCDLGAVEVSPVAPGDGNGDNKIDAGDLTACVLEVFDNDGNFWLDAPGGAFPGTLGCDANRDTVIDAGDLTCTALIIFNGPDVCGAQGPTTTPQPAQLTIGAAVPAAARAADGNLLVPIVLTSNGHAIAAVAFALTLGDTFDATDHNGDGIPDAVQIQGLPPGVGMTTTWHGGTLDILIADQSAPLITLADGPLLTVAVDSVSTVAFAETISPSLGNVTGQSVPVQLSAAAITQLYLPVVQR